MKFNWNVYERRILTKLLIASILEESKGYKDSKNINQYLYLCGVQANSVNYKYIKYLIDKKVLVPHEGYEGLYFIEILKLAEEFEKTELCKDMKVIFNYFDF